MKTITKELDNKGFTMIEIAAVLVILGTLLTLALPRITESTIEADEINISNNVLVLESRVAELLVLNSNEVHGWPETGVEKLVEFKDNEKLYDNNGQVHKNAVINELGEPYREIPGDFTKDELKKETNGIYYTNSKGKVFYGHLGDGVSILDTEHQ